MKPPVPVNKRMRMVVLMLFILAVIFAIFYSRGIHNKPTPADINANIAGVYLPKTIALNDFNLVDNHGNAFTKKNLQGKWSLVFFGFTNCGSVCPTTMSAMNGMYESLLKDLPKELMPQVVLISVDPERDSVKKMDDYVNAFNAKFIGVRGDITEIAAIEKQLHLVVVKLESGEGKNQYTIDHSAEIMVFNPQGEVQAYLTYPHKADALVHDYKKIVGA